MDRVKLSMIVAMAKNRAIGKDNKLLWHLPEDLKHFKKTTMGKPMIMGRKTYESLPGVLPGRPHFVVTRSDIVFDHPQVSMFQSIDDAITEAKSLDQDEIFIVGGGQIYAQTLPIINRLYITIVDEEIEGADTFFPEFNWDNWDIADEVLHPEANGKPAFTIYTLDRIDRA